GCCGRRPAKAGAALIALRSRAPVYPVAIRGGPQTIHVLKSWLWPAPTPVRVTYGPPIDLSAYYGRPITRRLLEEVSRHIMQSIYELAPDDGNVRPMEYKLKRRASNNGFAGLHSRRVETPLAV